MENRYGGGDVGGSTFMLGLLTGAAIGAGLALLFAPKTGSETRRQLSEQAGNWRDAATKTYRRASQTAGDLADRGRDFYNRASDAVSRAAQDVRDAGDELQRPTT